MFFVRQKSAWLVLSARNGLTQSKIKGPFFCQHSTNANTAHSNSILLHDQPDTKATLIFRAKANPHTREQTITPISVTFRAIVNCE